MNELDFKKIRNSLVKYSLGARGCEVAATLGSPEPTTQVRVLPTPSHGYIMTMLHDVASCRGQDFMEKPDFCGISIKLNEWITFFPSNLLSVYPSTLR